MVCSQGKVSNRRFCLVLPVLLAMQAEQVRVCYTHRPYAAPLNAHANGLQAVKESTCYLYEGAAEKPLPFI